MSVDTIFQSFGPLAIGSIQVGVATGGTVADPTTAWKDMAFHWRLPHTLINGTYYMRLSGEIYLPRHPKETRMAYLYRVQRSFLFPAYTQTLNSLAARPFAKIVTLGENTDQRLKNLASDIDMEGRDITMFTRDLLHQAIHDGIAAIYVDYPVTNTQISLAEEKAMGIRPFFRLIPMQDLIEVRSRRIGGRDVVIRVRIHEQATEPAGPWGEIVNDYIRVIEPDRFTLYKAIRDANDNVSYVITDSGPNTLGYVPIVPVYTNRRGFYKAYPALEEIAWLNLKHWQSQSDQDHILHIARVPILFGKGFDKETKEQEIGASTFIMNESKDSDLRYVETEGKGIEAGANSLLDTERQMAILGYEPLLSQQRSSRMTATQRVMDNSQIESPLQSWVRNTQNSLEIAFGYAADWMKLPKNVKDDHTGALKAANVSINTDFPLATQEVENLRTLVVTRTNGDITRETYLRNLKRVDILEDTLDVKTEAAAAAKEGPPVGAQKGSANGGGAAGAGGPSDKVTGYSPNSSPAFGG